MWNTRLPENWQRALHYNRNLQQRDSTCHPPISVRYFFCFLLWVLLLLENLKKLRKARALGWQNKTYFVKLKAFRHCSWAVKEKFARKRLRPTICPLTDLQHIKIIPKALPAKKDKRRPLTKIWQGKQDLGEEKRRRLAQNGKES